LARDHFGRTDGVDHPVPWGAALEHEGVWTALLEVSPERSFGQALVLGVRNQAVSLDLIAAENAGAVARRASLFDPSPTVWRLDGTTLSPAEPEEHVTVVAADIEPHIADLLALDDVVVITEHGSIIGECLGLEVARVTGAGSEQRLDVGVGAYDQGAFAAINPHMAPIEALAEVVAQVLTHRRKNALTHPINRMVRERWVRSELMADPSQIGMATLEIVEPMLPATASGILRSRRPLVPRPTATRCWSPAPSVSTLMQFPQLPIWRIVTALIGSSLCFLTAIVMRSCRPSLLSLGSLSSSPHHLNHGLPRASRELGPLQRDPDG